MLEMKSRKGLPTVTIVVGLVATLLVGSAILGSLQAIKTSSLDPNVEQTNNALGQVGDRTVTIGTAGDSDTARQQMQGAIVWNMLAASDCRILVTFNGLSQGEQSDDFDEREMPANPIEGKVFKTSPSDFLDELAGNGGNGYTGNFDDFLPLIESGFDYPCTGTQSTIKEMEDTIDDAQRSIVDGVLSGAYKAVGAGLVITGAASCIFTAGGGCGAAALGAGMIVGSGAAGDIAGGVIVPGSEDIGAEPGFDMEGVFSRMEFNIEKTFMMGTESHDEPFLAMALKFNKPDNTPGFWRGKRFSYLVPKGLTPNGFNKDKFHRIYDPGSNSPLVKQDFNGGNIPGTQQERKEMMFYAFRPKMVNVPIVADQELTEDILTDGCENDGCSWDVKRLGNFIDHTSYLFCEGASGEITSNAGHIYSSDEATSQESAIEDQVYPKVEITENATGCISTTTLSVPDSVDLDCDAEDILGGNGVEIFSRETINRGTHTNDVVCGADDVEESADLGGYGNVNYRLPEETISRQGCFADWYDVTTDAEMGGSTLQSGDYPTVLTLDDGNIWSHNYNTEYNDGDGENEVGEDGKNNRLTYESVAAQIDASGSGNFVYRVSIEGVSLGRVPGNMVGTTNVKRTIIIEELPEDEETIVREIAEDPNSNVGFVRKVDVVSEDFSGQVRELIIDRTGDGISINGETLTSFDGFTDQIAITDIEISPVRDAEQYNSEYDWDSGEGSAPDLKPTQTGLKLQGVSTYSEPRVCKGNEGVWSIQGQSVIEG